MHKKHNFTGHLCIVWNKTRPDRIIRAARAFKGLAPVGASMQSTQPEVLKVIKRKNLPIEVARNMSEELQGEDVGFYSELIAGLPEQTFDGHLNDNRVLMEMGANVFNYNLRLLYGTEMSFPESQKKYVLKSGWRLTSDAFDIYESATIFEVEEVVLETPAMSEKK
jgi:coproporphyrinogen III oxidase-like Fe-S oxidoreductase